MQNTQSPRRFIDVDCHSRFLVRVSVDVFQNGVQRWLLGSLELWVWTFSASGEEKVYKLTLIDRSREKQNKYGGRKEAERCTFCQGVDFGPGSRILGLLSVKVTVTEHKKM